VCVPDGRPGTVIGFYRADTAMGAAVSFDDGACRTFVLSDLRLAPGNDQTLLREITERMKEARDEGFNIVMPVGEWIDAQLWPAAEAEE
jgi:hypothetical protein